VPLWPGTVKDELGDYYAPELSAEDSHREGSVISPEPSSINSVEQHPEKTPKI
jgi:hypothetical protein